MRHNESELRRPTIGLVHGLVGAAFCVMTLAVAEARGQSIEPIDARIDDVTQRVQFKGNRAKVPGAANAEALVDAKGWVFRLME